MERTVAAIDVGTSKICTLVGEVADNGVLRVIGVGIVPSRGVRKGVITDVEEATLAISESVQKAERVSGHTITEAYVAVGGSHVSSQNSRGLAAIGRGDRPVDRDDIDRALEAAQAIAVPHNRRIIHSMPREFVIDGQDVTKNPLGLMGFRLEVEAHIVTGAITSIQNLTNCIERNHIAILELIPEPLASAEAVLTAEECNMGVALVDIGAGTTDLSIYVAGSTWETQVFAVGGNHLTNDIAVGMRTPFATAEDAKVRYAHALPMAVPQSEMIEIAKFGEESLGHISRRALCEIVALRTEEIIDDLILREIKRSGFDGLLPAGVVITGGMASLTGIRELAARVLQMPVRVGMPRRLHGLVETISSPAYATAVGLLLWGIRAETAVVESTPRLNTRGGWHGRFVEWLKLILPRV